MNEIIRTELLPGTTLCGGKYIIEKKIGAGGFGITYIAKHATLGKKYAIKEFFLSGYNVRNNKTNHISLQGIEEKDFTKIKQRFIEEARTLASLNNDAVVKVIDIFDENGTSYMVMPFVEGVTLQSMVEKDGPMDYDIAVNYIVRICDALSYIHSKDILHRDVTPDNIIVTPDQKTVLIDFGSARKFVNDKTQRHTTILKQGYAPLEQYSATSRKGAYTDLYSLGGVLYYILTGVRPIDATERTMESIKDPIELNPKIPKQINAVIMKAMAMDSSERYQSAIELEEDILSGNFPKETKKTAIKRNSFVPNLSKAKELVLILNDISVRKYAAVVLPIVALIVLFIAIMSRHQDNTGSDIAEIDSILVEKEVAPISISIDSMMNENEDAIMQRLTDNSCDPAALYVIARKAITSGLSEEMGHFWHNVLVNEGDVAKYVGGGECYKGSFAFVCAARAYENLNKYNYSEEMKKELKNSLITFMERLNENGVNGKKVYE